MAAIEKSIKQLETVIRTIETNETSKQEVSLKEVLAMKQTIGGYDQRLKVFEGQFL